MKIDKNYLVTKYPQDIIVLNHIADLRGTIIDKIDDWDRYEKEQEDIIKNIAKETGITYEEVEDIIFDGEGELEWE